MAVKIEHLSLKRGNRLLIKDLSVSLEKSESLLLTGPNGVGKTTLIRSIAGFIQPEAGSITLNLAPDSTKTASETALETASDQAELIHYIGHKNGIRTSLTVLENLEFWCEFYGSDKPLNPVIKSHNLSSLIHIPAGYLSAGQKRRLSLAKLALIKKPLWLLDEPTVSLDELSAKLVADAASQHLNAGGILIAATHIPLDIPFTRTIELKNLGRDQFKTTEWEELI